MGSVIFTQPSTRLSHGSSYQKRGGAHRTKHRSRADDEPVNVEGLTWAEWSCAAGVAKFEQPKIPFAEPRVVGEFLRRPDGGLVPWGFERYGHEVRRAWAEGEDPTEWRDPQGITAR